MNQLPENLMMGRLLLGKVRDFFAEALCSIEARPDERCPTIGVDKYWRAVYNPKVVAEWTVEGCMTAWYHELRHLLDDHPHRCEMMKADPFGYNLAGDAAINGDIREETYELAGEKKKFVFPIDPVMPEHFKMAPKLFAEEYYNSLPKVRVHVERVAGEGHSCGSCAHGQPMPWEDGPPNGKNGGISETEQKIIKTRVAQAVLEAASREAGNVPDWAKKWADKLIRPRVPWQREIRSVLSNAIQSALGYSDYSWELFNNQSPPRLILPSMVNSTPRVLFLSDTSGSMTPADHAVLGEVDGLFRLLRAPVLVMTFDTEKKDAKFVSSARQAIPLLVGGGGTDMAEGIRVAVSQKPRPHLVVVHTDGYTGWPAEPIKGVRVVALVTQKAAEQPPKWIKTIRIDVG